MEGPQAFLDGLRGKRAVLDEHWLDNPSQLLTIAADHYPDVRIVAIGSSSFGASSKFRATQPGRKAEHRLIPMCLAVLELFGMFGLLRGFLHGAVVGCGFPAPLFERERLRGDPRHRAPRPAVKGPTRDVDAPAETG